MTLGTFITRIHCLLCFIVPCPSEQGLGMVVPWTLCSEEVPEGMGMFREERISLKNLSLLSSIIPFVP